MMAVIFEVMPHEAHRQDYLDGAALLAPKLAEMDGFISIERFASLSQPGKILSLSFWRDEAAVKGWRNVAMHREIQAKGRAYIFEDYRLRVAAVVRDYGMFDRAEAPDDSRHAHPPRQEA